VVFLVTDGVDDFNALHSRQHDDEVPRSKALEEATPEEVVRRCL
jgi:hypothetical protein